MRSAARTLRALARAAIAASLLLSASASTAQRTSKREPSSAKEDISQIGNRGVGSGTFNMYTLKEEQSLGRKFASQIERRETIIGDPLVAEFVNRVAQNIARNSDAKVPITAKVISSREVNAMALPGGYVFVNSGLIQLARDESELGGVLAHEIAHVAARHGARSVTRAIAANTAAQAIGSILGVRSKKAALVFAIAEIGLPMAFLKFSRDFERQADFLGVQYLFAAGYDPLGMVQFFERMAALKKRDQDAVSALFRSHPLTKGRIRRVQEAIGDLMPDRPAYNVTGSEFEAVKERLASLSKRREWLDSP